MSDHDLRSLERQNNTADPHAQAAHLAARMRSEVSGLWTRCNCVGTRNPPRGEPACYVCNGTGRVSMLWDDRIALAAYCGDAGARLLVPRRCSLCNPFHPDNPCPSTKCWCCSGQVSVEGWCGRCSTFQPGDIYPERFCLLHEKGCGVCPPKKFPNWLQGLNRWPPYVLIRAAVAAARVVHAGQCSGSTSCERMSHHQARRAIEAAERWLDDPSEENLKAAVACTQGRLGQEIQFWEGAALILRQGGQDNQSPAAFQAAARETSEQAVRTAICEALITWVLQ